MNDLKKCKSIMKKYLENLYSKATDLNYQNILGLLEKK